MKPILFDENANTFTTNGLGRLDCHSCTVTEERNGQFELEMTIAESALHADQIGMNSIIVARASQGSGLQAFRVYQITKPLNGVFKVYANHISYQLSMIPTMPFSVTASASACQTVLNTLKSNAVESCPFTFSTDVTTVAPYNQKTPSSIRSRLGGIEGSVLDQYGGEYEFDNYSVILHKNRGLTTPQVTLRYGKNITDLNQEENIANTITGIVPFWADNEGTNVVTLPEKVVDSQYASHYPFKRTVPKDFSSDFDEEPTVAQLRAKAQAYVTSIGIPVVSIKLSFVNLADTEEFKDLIPLQSVNLCDNITVQFEKYGISTTAKIVKTVYDVLAERYESIEIGSLRSSLATTISEQNADTITTITSKFEKVGTEIDNATAWLTSSGGYVVAVKNNDGSWKELLFLDTNDTATAHNVLRINENGIGFSSNGVSGPYTQAWTLDGRLVIGGTNVPSITVYDNQNNIIFQASATAMIWNATNSSMDATGVISMTGAQITGGTLKQTDGTSYLSIENGIIKLGNSYQNEIGRISYLPYNQRYNLQIKSTGGDMRIDADNNDLYLSNINDIWINNYGGHTGYVTDVETIDHMSDFNLDVTTDTINNVTYDLDIDMNAGTASWNYVTIEYVTWVSATWNNNQTSVCVQPEYARKGIVT